MKTQPGIKNNKIDEKEVFDLAMKLPNARMSRDAWEYKVYNIPRLQRMKDFKERVFSGGELAFIEARMLAKEQLSFNHWLITFYEFVQLPQIRFFETEAEAMDYYTRATVDGRTARGAKIMAQRMELYGPKKELFGKRETLFKWKCEGYEPDPMCFTFR
jgi:hypothetical protein